MPHIPQVSRERSGRVHPHRRGLLLATVFLVVFGASYLLAGRRLPETAPQPVTAAIILSGVPAEESLPDVTQLRQFVAEVVPEAAAEIAIECQHDASSARWQVVVADQSDDDRQRAADRVDTLAEQIARWTAAAWSESRCAPAEEAARATQVLWEQLEEARVQLDAARPAPPPPTPSPSPVAVPPPGPEPVENPRHVELQQRLAEAERLRDALLTHRTSAHPEVQRAQERVLGLRAELAEVPHHLPGPPAMKLLHAESAPEPFLAVPAAPPQSSWPRDADLAALRAEVHRLDRDYQAALEQERTAWQAAADPLTVHVQLAARERPAAAVATAPALLVALAAAFGASGVVALAMTAHDRAAALRSALEVQAALPVPVLGMVGRNR